MNSTTNNPSIFTAKDSGPELQRPPVPTLIARTSSPFGKRSTSEGLGQAGIEPEPPFAVSLPDNTLARETNAGIGSENAEEKEARRETTVWDSFRSTERREGSSPAIAALPKARSASASHLIIDTPTEEHPPILSPPLSSYHKKRASESTAEDQRPSSDHSYKRPRLRLPNKPYLAGFGSGSLTNCRSAIEPPSPLFFSHSAHQRPAFPPRFSSGEAAAKMMSKARAEESHVKTVSLARGVVSSPSPGYGISPSQQPGTTPGRQSMDRSMTGRSSSPDATSSRDIGSVLSSIGVTELLEQDERPTFIVDLADSANFGTAVLRPLFTNSALRSYAGLEEVVTGAPSSDVRTPSAQTFLSFKSWLLGSAVNGESLNVCLPPFVFANMSWTCSTLRKRLRIMSGSFLAPPSARRRASRPSIEESIVHNPEMDPAAAILAKTAATYREPVDYFGPTDVDSAPTQPSESSSSTATAAVPTIEHGPLPIGAHMTAQRHRSRFGTESASDLSEITDLLPDASTHISVVPADYPSFDWTRLPLSESMPAHVRFARSIDWGSTSLGPIEGWSSDLRQMCNLIMASPHPAAMYWGDDYVAIYNEAYILLAGQKHPSLMGMTYAEAWGEIWDDVKDVFAAARMTGEATMKDDDCLFIKRNDYLEETYFSWSIIPMVGREGSVMGLYNPAFEKTRRKIAERRMLTLREVGERTASARDVKSFWSQVLGSFDFNEYDSPFLMLYSVSEEHDSDSSSIHSNSVFATRQCVLEGSLGVPEDHPAAPEMIDLKVGLEGFGPVFREVMKTDKPAMVEVGTRDLPHSLLDGLESRGFGDPVRAVCVCPIHPTTGESVLGFLILGVNPRRPYDDDYLLFVQLLSRQLATSLASVVLFEEEIRRGQKAAKLAALDRIELSQQLAARTQEAMDSETKFTRMAEFAPVGIFIADSAGEITFANDTWYDISRVPKNSNMADTWMDFIMATDYDKVVQLWNDLVVSKKPVSAEFRFKAPWEDRSGHRSERWALFSAYPERNEDGELKSVFGSITNISQQKWAEGIQTRKMEEAVEMKRQQENFIDITSHEMRNPLSAILQCSDEITSTLMRAKNSGEPNLPEEMLTSCLDAAQIINLCSQHQKRIVDDILTLSKLDSQLLLVTPVDAQPLTVVQRALKMHEGELQAADIQMKFVVDQSYRDMDLDWVRFDPSRVLQVLINLTTNAIKFTGTEKKRTISVTISASTLRPSERADAPVEYFSTRRQNKAMIDEKDWGEGDKVFVHFAVRDTGRGLNPEEKKMLFMRFSQASPRTHVQYGGSGLGLFISRELTELQGGEIGVESEAGRGSTFAFYVLARKSVAPADADGNLLLSPAQGSKPSASHPVPREKIPHLTPALPATSNGSSSKAPAAAPKRRVLIVEDNLVNQRVLQKQLKNLGTEVHLANHGGEALEKLRQSSYWKAGVEGGKEVLQLGVVLMDQEMPIMDGLTCTRRIREMEVEGALTGHVPIIAVTANARAEQVQTALGAGMDDVVSKPFRIPELVPKIEELMLRYPAPGAST